ncbi:insulinase family protein [Kibdelosporangium philippinense]|uniref:Insulinase family protein n=1 Tax=Kibdelosporangium philippinense TaxID=211113 RepID=A0ABS8ZF18_9PSEU|nr:pitrilysin family protein [Kibdelosporangium philippinense]MCE7006419.1 insulinase family protein [Kibdelosporangium philippinense]
MSQPWVDTFSLSNGLRVVLAPDNAFPLAAVSVHYDVGFRSEPPGCAGFASLLEHLMFQGSESVANPEHSFYVQSSGGSYGGTTYLDYTSYHSVIPAVALERALFLEADRMRAPRLTEENFRRQVAAVKQSVKRNVLDLPYGRFPWALLPSLLHRTFPNACYGYGDFSELDEATLDDGVAFFESYYAPGNAVLAVAGDFAVDEVKDLLEQHFGDVPARQAPHHQPFIDPPPQGEIHGEHYDPNAPLPALAIGYRLPDPATDLDSYLANVMLAILLSDGDKARLRRVVHEVASVVDLTASCGIRAPFDARHPEVFTISCTHVFAPDRERLLGLIDAELALLSKFPPDQAEMSEVVGRWLADHYSQRDILANRARAYGKFELLFDDAAILDRLVDGMRRVTGEHVSAAAEALSPDDRAVLTLRTAGDTL